MEVREGVPDDADAIESRSTTDLDASRLLVDRRVIVAENEGKVVGFCAYEAWDGTVHVSAINGEPSVVERLLEEPRRFAEREGLPIEIVVPESDEEVSEAVDEAGFDPVGPGPRFAGEPTRRYRDAR